MRYSTIRQALQQVADNPVLDTDELISLPASELVCRTLFEIANSPTRGDRMSMSRANAARSMIFDRLVGKRSPGSHPATRNEIALSFMSLTGAEE